MSRFQFRKLIRDKILALHLAEGHEVEYRNLAGVELKTMLRQKIHEEADEIPIREIIDDEVIEEISDVQQALDDLKQQYGISDEQVRTAQTAKHNKKGGFADGVFIESVELPEDDKWVAYYRASPDKYPEIDLATGHVDPVLPQLEIGTYQHAKSGKQYDVVGVTFHTETNELLVVYRPLYDSKYKLFARPYDMFVETIELDGKKRHRFEKVA